MIITFSPDNIRKHLFLIIILCIKSNIKRQSNLPIPSICILNVGVTQFVIFIIEKYQRIDKEPSFEKSKSCLSSM